MDITIHHLVTITSTPDPATVAAMARIEKKLDVLTQGLLDEAKIQDLIKDVQAKSAAIQAQLGS